MTIPLALIALAVFLIGLFAICAIILGGSADDEPRHHPHHGTAKVNEAGSRHGGAK